MSTEITHAEKPFIVFWLMTMTLLSVFPLDVVLPSFPALAEHFSTSTTQIARSVSLFAIGFSCSMLLIGPLSDRIGRKKLLLASMAVAIMGAAGCLTATNTPQFLFFRVIQAIGCGGFILSQALVQDLFFGREQERLRIAMVTAGGIFISISPLMGAWLQLHGGWQASFYVFIALCAVTLIMAHRLLHGGVPQAAPSHQSLFKAYAKVFANRHFASYATISAITFSCHFSFIVVSPLIFMDQLQLSPHEYSLTLLLYGAAYVLGGVSAGFLHKRLPAATQMAIGLVLIAISGVVMLFLAYQFGLSTLTVLMPMLLCTAGTTITRPISNSKAMSLFPDNAGTAASAVAAELFIAGGLISAFISTFAHHLSTALGLCFLILSIIALVLNTWARRHPHVP
ncbi:MFS transporter [Pseudomonas reactans]|jgi:MFS family permease|uniref:MFS transporter n=1 Tax=Pseudomonas reactans TaxID=117680 RepID=A0ABX2QV54_9PSED|nr:MFS transporter [Pseudomonas reactans]NWA40120.1 MFS transporter [Pseudomonas reactans]NWC84831.1 MFS transporter [Pseudomonas reactans]NWD31473.1 MFS transporter [Pseudomonas reactans]NWD94445.1 MFS transporter [Pseudomonas reactans]NWF15829.1 MFS transporter [Pseudomonas reactans]